MLDSLNEISDAADKEIQEMHAMVLAEDTEEELEESHSELQALFLADYTDEELEESDSEMQASVHGDFTEEEQVHWSAEEKLVHALVLADYTEEELEESESGYGIYQAADIDEGIPMVINGLEPQQSSLQKIVDWLVNME